MERREGGRHCTLTCINMALCMNKGQKVYTICFRWRRGYRSGLCLPMSPSPPVSSQGASASPTYTVETPPLPTHLCLHSSYSLEELWRGAVHEEVNMDMVHLDVCLCQNLEGGLEVPLAHGGLPTAKDSTGA